MNIGQILQQWFARLQSGELKTPQQLHQAAQAENLSPAQASDRFFKTPDDSALWDIPTRLSAPRYFLSESYLKQSERADWQFTDQRLMRWAALFVEYARKRGIPLYVHCSYRDAETQNGYKKKGTSKVSYPNSAHNIGEAVDVVHSIFHWEMTQQEWYFLHLLGRKAQDRINATLKKEDKLILNWGGDDETKTDKFRWDPAHWEILSYRDRVRWLKPANPIHYTPRRILTMFK